MIDQGNTQLTTVIAVYDADTVGQCDAMFYAHPTSGEKKTDAVIRRHLDGQAGMEHMVFPRHHSIRLRRESMQVKTS